MNKPAEKEASQNRIPFVFNWHTKFRDFGTIIHRNYRKILSEYARIKSVFPAPPLLSFRRNKNLKDILVRSSFTQPSNKPSTALGKPNHRSSLICPAMSTSDKIINKKSHVVYAAECTKHQLLYVGFTTRPLHLPVNNHRSEINLGAHTCEPVQHLSTLDWNFDKDLKIHILQHGLPNNKDACEAEEDKWIIKLITKSPNGMNTVLHDFGQFYKTLF